MGQLAGGIPDLPLYLLHLAIVAREPLDFRPAELERSVVEESLKRPAGRAMRIVPQSIEPKKATLVRDGRLRFGTDGEEPSFRVEVGPAASGSIVFVHANHETLDLGPPLAPQIIEAFRFLDDEWDLGLGTLEAATDVRG